MLSVDGTSFAARPIRATHEAQTAPDAEREVLRAHIRSVLIRIPGRRARASAQAN